MAGIFRSGRCLSSGPVGLTAVMIVVLRVVHRQELVPDLGEAICVGCPLEGGVPLILVELAYLVGVVFQGQLLKSVDSKFDHDVCWQGVIALPRKTCNSGLLDDWLHSASMTFAGARPARDVIKVEEGKEWTA